MDIKDLVNYGGFVFGILGIVLSIYLFKKGLEAKDPRCYYKTIRNISKLSDDNDAKIRIFYGQEEVTRIFTTRVWIWNNGKKPIYRTDIPPQSNIKITLQDNEFTPKILDFEIIRMSRSEINFSVSPIGETSLTIGFDFLDQNDGAVVEIQHTGSRETELAIEGVILGVPEGLKLIEINKKKSAFTRSVLLANSLFDIRRNPRILFASSAFMLLVLIGMAGWVYYDMKTDLTVSVSTSKLRETLISEIPQATDQNIANIMATISDKGIVASKIYVVFVIGFVTIMSVLLAYLNWKLKVLPYPKVLKLDDDFIQGKTKAG